MNENSFIERLRFLISKLHVTDTEFAKAGGVSKGTFSNYINGNSQPKQEALALWVQKYGLDANWLLTGRGEMFLGEEAQPDDQKKENSITDPIAQRMKVAADSLEKAGASPELIQQTFFKILELPNEPHTQAEENISTPDFANHRDRSIKQP